jgi:hypothetical protein
MSSSERSNPSLEGPGSEVRLRRIRRRFVVASRTGNLPLRSLRLRAAGRNLLVAYWAACVLVILAGLPQIYPDLWPRLQRALPGPDVDRPFRNCAEAHAAGVYNIPFWSSAYVDGQDGDDDGTACEPAPQTG